MSDTETWKGKIREIPYTDYELDEFLYKLIITYKSDYEYEEMLSVEENFQEAFWEMNKYILIKNRVYLVLEQENLQYKDIFEAERGKDGNINFLVQYYNGGCGFSEAIGYALESMEKK